MSPDFPHAAVSVVQSPQPCAGSTGTGSASSSGTGSTGSKWTVSSKKDGCDCKCPLRVRAPDVPTELPMEAVPQNVKKLQQWILDYYASSAFNCCECQALPAMHGPPLHIHMQKDATPVASHCSLALAEESQGWPGQGCGHRGN